MSGPEKIQLDATVGAEQAGKRLDQAAAELFSDFSRGRLQRWIRSGDLTVDGETSKPTAKVWGGASLKLEAVAESQGEVFAQDIPLNIIHADDDIIVLNKPAGLVVHPAAGNPDGTLPVHPGSMHHLSASFCWQYNDSPLDPYIRLTLQRNTLVFLVF